MGAPGSGDQALQRAFNDADESINVTVGGAGVTLEAGDIEIGAVEIKDGGSNNRATVDGDGNVHITPRPNTGSFTDRSNTIQAGGAAQQVMAANAQRKYLLFENVSDTDLWVRFGNLDANADQPSILVPPRAVCEMDGSGFVNTDKMTVIGATTGKSYTAKEA
jgi:hypothetical protein